MIDIVYPFGAGSSYYNDELRFSLRSVEQYTKPRKIFLVGEKPPFSGMQVEHIPVENTDKCPDVNIFRKILAAARHDGVSDPFLMMYDDIYLLRPLDIEHCPAWCSTFPARHLEAPDSMEPKYFYSQCVKSTYKYLRYFGITTPMFFDLHTPMLIRKTPILRMAELKLPEIYTFKSMYGNLYPDPENKRTLLFDVKVTPKGFNANKMSDQNWPCFSTPPQWTSRILDYLYSRFEQRAEWEKHES